MLPEQKKQMSRHAVHADFLMRLNQFTPYVSGAKSGLVLVIGKSQIRLLILSFDMKAFKPVHPHTWSTRG